jgi:uroporphyrinogen-III synthase
VSAPSPARNAVVVTRAESADGPLCRELRGFGLEVLLWPAIAVGAPDAAALGDAIGAIGSFDWIVFASRHAVSAVLERLPQPPPALKVAAVGHATAQVLRGRGWLVDLVPDESSAGALVAAFAARLKPAERGCASSTRRARAPCRRSPQDSASSAPG